MTKERKNLGKEKSDDFVFTRFVILCALRGRRRFMS